jgi:hypothetical protein
MCERSTDERERSHFWGGVGDQNDLACSYEATPFGQTLMSRYGFHDGHRPRVDGMSLPTLRATSMPDRRHDSRRPRFMGRFRAAEQHTDLPHCRVTSKVGTTNAVRSYEPPNR